jgi:BolA protein
MNDASTGPVAREMRLRLENALAPATILLRDDSEKHRGHGGYNPAGESHFFLSIESPSFAGLTRVQRQRLVYKALGELMHSQVHALAMETKAPGE